MYFLILHSQLLSLISNNIVYICLDLFCGDYKLNNNF